MEFPFTVGLVKLRANLNRESIFLGKALADKSGLEMTATHNELNEIDHQIDEHMLELSSISLKVPQAEAKMKQFGWNVR